MITCPEVACRGPIIGLYAGKPPGVITWEVPPVQSPGLFGPLNLGFEFL